MIKPDLFLPPLKHPANTGEDTSVSRYRLHTQENTPAPAQRLIVLIPTDLEHPLVTRRIWELANAMHCRVQLLGVCRRRFEEPGLRRQLATLAALIGHGGVSVEVKIEIKTSWLQAVRANYQPGDLIVCFSEQRGFLHKPLQQILETRLDAAVYVLSEPQTQKTRRRWFSQVLGWSGSFVIILAFGILQARISQLPEDWFQSVLFILSMFLEFWLIWVWNSLYD